MKKLILLLILVSMGTVFSERNGTWNNILDRDSTGNIFGFCMADSLNGMILGRKSLTIYVKKTSDGGNSWVDCYIEKRQYDNFFEGSYISPRHIAYTDENNCYITLDSGNILKTSDGGLNWSKINITDKQLMCITMHDNNTGGITTYKSLYVTKDGWKTWQKADFPDSLDSLYYIAKNFTFINEITPALLICNKGQYYTMISYDFGISWELIPYKRLMYLDIRFLDDSIGFNCFDYHGYDTTTHKDVFEALINKTTDGGKTWFPVFDSLDYRGFWSLELYDGIIFATGTGSRAYMSTDTGSTWINLRDYNDYIGENLCTWTRCSAISKNEFLTCGQSSGVWKWTNTPNTVIDLNEESDLFVFPNPATEFIRLEGDGAAVSIYNILGVKMIDSESNSAIDVSGLAPGVYFIRCGARSLRFVKE